VKILLKNNILAICKSFVKMINFAPRKKEAFFSNNYLQFVSILLQGMLLSTVNTEVNKIAVREVYPL